MRKSIGSRIDRLARALHPVGTLENRIARLSDDERTAWLMHKERVRRINFVAGERPGDRYANYLANADNWPRMHPALEAALFPYMAAVRNEPDARLGYDIMLTAKAD